jgi:hypothetical protein
MAAALPGETFQRQRAAIIPGHLSSSVVGNSKNPQVAVARYSARVSQVIALLLQ